MAPKSAGSSPASPNLTYNTNSYIANHFNILNSKKQPRITVKFTKKSHKLIQLLYNSRIIQNYLVIDKNNKKYIIFNTYYYKSTSYFSHLKIVSTPSKAHTISLKALNISNKSLGNSIMILETDKGVITHQEALSYKIGGKILGVIS